MDQDLPRWLIVVRRDRRELYESLRRGFQEDGRVEVILDRRTGSRRTESRPGVSERRRSSRRRGLTPEQAALWEGAGFRMLHRDEGYDVYQAEAAKTEVSLKGEQNIERDQRLRATLLTALSALEARGDRKDEELRRLLEAGLRLLEGRSA